MRFEVSDMLHENLDPNEIIFAAEHDTYAAFCLHCGEHAGELEPDTHFLKCEECGVPAVFAAQEIAVCYPHLLE